MGINLKWASSPLGTKNQAVNSRNLVSDFGGVGDGQRATVTATISSGSPNLAVDTAIFSSGDTGKTLALWVGDTQRIITTMTFVDSTHATLGANLTGASISAASVDALWGTDNTDAFTGVSGWRAWAQTQTNPASPPVLYVPDGNYAFKSSTSAGGAMHYGVMNSAKVSGLSGTAANCKLMQFNGGEMRFGTDVAIVANRGLTDSGGNSARLQTAAASASSIFLVDPTTYGARIITNRACLLAAYDMQGIYESFFGYPPNSFFFEWNVITGYNSGTGEVALQNPLTQGYKSTYPRWGDESTVFGSDQGGPFTIWVAPDGYNNTVTLENMTIDSPHNQCSVHMRNVICNNIVNSGPGIYPTQADIVGMNNSVYTQTLEVDKMTNQVTWNNCTLTNLQQQSASPNRMILNGGTINQLETAKYTEANNVSFGGSARIICGVSAYGRTDRIVLNGCTGIALFQPGGGSTSDLGGTSGAGSVQDASDYYVFDTGVIKFLKSDNDSAGGQGQQNLTRLFAPGTWITFDDKYIDQIADVYEDGTHCYVAFASTTNWPFTPVSRLKVHPCPDFTMTSCTGTAPELEDWNQAPARIPLYSYVKRTYDKTLLTSGAANPFIMGHMVATDAMSVNVTTAYTGAQGTLTWRPTQFANHVRVFRAGAVVTLNMAINAKISGNRVYNGATQTWSGAQSGDTLPAFLAGDWLMGTFISGPSLSANVSGESAGPVIVWEIKADQGII